VQGIESVLCHWYWNYRRTKRQRIHLNFMARVRTARTTSSLPLPTLPEQNGVLLIYESLTSSSHSDQH